MRTAVVFAAPFGPRSPKTLACGAWKSIPSSAARSPKRLRRSSTRMAASLMTTHPLTGYLDMSSIRSPNYGNAGVSPRNGVRSNCGTERVEARHRGGRLAEPAAVRVHAAEPPVVLRVAGDGAHPRAHEGAAGARGRGAASYGRARRRDRLRRVDRHLARGPARG